MSFINIAKQGVQGFSKYGKFIGEGKNNGIKVYERLEANGNKVLSSLNKEGELIKEIDKNRWNTVVYNLVDGSTTSLERNLASVDGGDKFKFGYTKIFKDESAERLLRTYMIPDMNYYIGGKNSEEVMRHIRSPKGKMQVAISQITPGGDSICLTKYFGAGRANIDVKGNFKLAPDVVLNEG